jgi:cold shock CspA family protein
MRIHGNLKKWDDERGFGFIASPQNADEIFVHISSFPKDGVRPKVGELISFEIQTEKNGKSRAIRVLRPSSGKPRRDRSNAKSRKCKVPLKVVSAFIAAVLFVFFGYNTYNNHQTSKFLPLLQTKAPVNTIEQSFKCDGRQHCSQMNSRAEAEFFSRNCPNTKMDGDNDGIPCENDSRF